MRLLWLLPEVNYTSAARQALLLAPVFRARGHTIEVGVLRSGGAFTSSFHSAGITLHELSSPHDVPFRAIGELEKLLRGTSFELIHAWRLPSMRTMATLRLARSHRPRLVVSQLERGGRWNPLDRLLRQKADRVVPDLGDPRAVPLAVASLNDEKLPLDLALPENARLIMALGELTPEHGFRDAVWAFDVLKFVYPDIHLIIVGDGPEHDRLVHFSQRLAGTDIRTHFVRGRPDAARWLTQATIGWVPSRKPCGEQVLLEAQSVGVPVVATGLPGVSSLIADQTTGVIVKVGDPVGLAMATRPLLDNASIREKLVAAAQLRLSNHRPEVIADRWLQIYDETRHGAVA